MISKKPFGFGMAAAIGVSALLLGVAGAAPAHADSWDSYGRNHVYRDVADVRRDESRLRDLQFRHDEARRHHDWDRMHALDRQIADLRRHIDHDRREIRDERRADNRYRDNDRNRNDRLRYRDSSYRDRYDR
jgi:hypothetical protein